MERNLTFTSIQEAVQEAYNLYKENTDGKNADYIPYLAQIDSRLFGISVCLLDGRSIEAGDTQYAFGIESVSKVHTAILALRQYGAEKLLSMIGADATGLQLDYSHSARKRPPFDSAGQCRSNRRVQHGQA